MTGATALGLPAQVRACLFDLDGVLTETAKIHAAAWKEMFDGYLRTRAVNSGDGFVPFDVALEYDTYVDGKTRGDRMEQGHGPSPGSAEPRTRSFFEDYKGTVSRHMRAQSVTCGPRRWLAWVGRLYLRAPTAPPC